MDTVVSQQQKQYIRKWVVAVLLLLLYAVPLICNSIYLYYGVDANAAASSSLNSEKPIPPTAMYAINGVVLCIFAIMMAYVCVRVIPSWWNLTHSADISSQMYENVGFLRYFTKTWFAAWLLYALSCSIVIYRVSSSRSSRSEEYSNRLLSEKNLNIISTVLGGLSVLLMLLYAIMIING